MLPAGGIETDVPGAETVLDPEFFQAESQSMEGSVEAAGTETTIGRGSAGIGICQEIQAEIEIAAMENNSQPSQICNAVTLLAGSNDHFTDLVHATTSQALVETN